MTGTPVANRPYDLWAQIYFLDQGKSLGSDFNDFKSKTDLSNNLSDNMETRKSFENTVSSIFEKIDTFSIRETKKTAGIVLPQKIYQTIYASFSPMQHTMYNTVIKNLMVELVRDGKVFIDDDSVALKRLLRLLQIASNPLLIDDSYQEKSGKEIELKKLLDTIISRGEKCIVWSSFIENIDYYSKQFKQYNPRKIHGAMNIEDRNRSVDLFKNDNDCKVLFATPQAAKEGLTLTVANNVIFYDRGFNLDDYLQAQDRIHRISQQKTCYVYNLMLKDSIDDWINNLLEAKQYAAFLAQGDISKTEYQELANYNYCDLIKEILQQEEL